MASPNDKPRRLTDFNHEIASLHLAKPKNSSGKGLTVPEDGVLFYPPDFQKDRKYPLF